MVKKKPIELNPSLTASQVGAELQIARESVIDLIMAGELEAYDAAPKTAVRRKWRITRKQLAEFQAKRAAAKPVKTPRPTVAVEVGEFV